jgi:hypothetical protein
MSDLRTLGRAMREAQRRYFKARTSENLEREATGWQPIATAPLGVQILLGRLLPSGGWYIQVAVLDADLRERLSDHYRWYATPPAPGGPHG